MSATSNVTVLGFGRWAVSRPDPAQAADRPLVRTATFAALALWGTSRWATLMKPAPAGRLYGICAIAIVVASVGAYLSQRNRVPTVVLAILAAIGTLAVAGIPLEWIRHLRIAVTADAIGQGLTALPDALVPYLGINEWVRAVIVLGGGVLLLDGAVLAALTPRPGGDLRRAAAALPLVALAVVPATIVRPGLPYLQGLVLFALLAAFMWGDRLAARPASGGVAIIALVAVLALIAAPRVDPRSAWIDYQSIAGSLSLKDVDHFNWAQTYGPLNWPRDNRTVFTVKAATADYWKVQNLEVFDGRGWAAQQTDFSAPVPPPSAAAVARWTQTLEVTIGAMKTPYVIAAGTAAAPQHVPEGSTQGLSPGTWLAGAALGPGATYTVKTYSPRPSAKQLSSVGNYGVAGNLPGDLSVELPPEEPATTSSAVTFTPFHFRRVVVSLQPGQANPLKLIERSPYEPMFRLARSLSASAATPYAYVSSVMHYLSHGFTYDEHPPKSAYPLETFLLSSKRGYCQQFAGAMALLLRMGGIPARVAVGFTPGTFNEATGAWQVSDLDAHAWVEAWFPRYGWVRFDPTPSVAPARGGHIVPLLQKGKLSKNGAKGAVGRREAGNTGSAPTPTHLGGSGSDTPWIVFGVVLLAAVAAIALSFARGGASRTPAQLVAELERAFRRSGRPVGDGVTLAMLERRLRGSEQAQAYVRAIRMQRFAAATGTPTTAQRRALRRQLAAGAGVFGRLRAVWALPPLRPARPPRRAPGS